MNSLSQNKGKVVVLLVYILLVFVSPIYSALTYNPEDIVEMIKGVISEEDDAFFKNYIALLKNQKNDEAFALMSEETQKSTDPENYKKFIEQFAGITDEVILVGGNITETIDPPRKQYNLTYGIVNRDSEYQYILVQISASGIEGMNKINSVQTQYLPESIVKMSEFTLPPFDWKFFVAVLVPLFVLLTAFKYLANSVKPKWWIFLLIVLGSLYITSWGANNHYGFNIGAYGFLGQSGLFGPWVYTTPMPIGALIYWLFRQKFNSAGTDNISSMSVPSDSNSP